MPTSTRFPHCMHKIPLLKEFCLIILHALFLALSLFKLECLILLALPHMDSVWYANILAIRSSRSRDVISKHHEDSQAQCQLLVWDLPVGTPGIWSTKASCQYKSIFHCFTSPSTRGAKLDVWKAYFFQKNNVFLNHILKKC